MPSAANGNMPPELMRAVYYYLTDYAAKNFLGIKGKNTKARILDFYEKFRPGIGDREFSDISILQHYTPVFEHMLRENIPIAELEALRSYDNLKPLFERLFKGKTIAELGCRGGAMLHFAKAHGAALVIGTTTEKYRELVNSRRNAFKSGTSIIYAPINAAAPDLEETGVKADLVFSHAMLGSKRYPGGRVPIEGISASIRALSRPETRVYIQPTIGEHNEVIGVKAANLADDLGMEVKVERMYHPDYVRAPFHQTWSFSHPTGGPRPRRRL